MKTYLGGGTAPRIVWPRHQKEMSDEPHAPAALPPGKEPSYPLDRRLGGTQSQSGCSGEEKNSQSPPVIGPPNPDHPDRRQSLYRWAMPALKF
jgi:hypothetical protein